LGNSNPPPYQFSPTELRRLKQRAQRVTIYRDAWGTPHVHGRTDADAVFGLAYATAEDRFQEMEPAWIRALGRSAEVDGPKATNWDILIRALEVPRLSKAEYAHASPRIRALAEAFADGINDFLATHPEVHPRLLTHFEPWYVFAIYRTTFDVNLDRTDIHLRELARVTLPRKPLRPNGSNAWAVAPAKSASGHGMLFMNPHVALTRPYEVHVMSDEGWNVSGETGPLMPVLPVLGHNASLGWSLTVNKPGIVGVWRETFDDPHHPLRYRFGNGYRTAETWTDSIRIRQKDGTFETRTLHFRKTIHGPILAVRDGHPLAVRMANIERGGLLQQFYAMGKAHDLAEFRHALDQEGLTYHNVMYADTAGHIFYLYDGAIPRRNPKYDWLKPVDGSDPGTMWHGYHSIDELPQVLDPPSGWLQNTNSSPFYATAAANPDRHDFPRYMVGHRPHQDQQNARSRESRRLLSRPGKFTFAEWQRMAFDTHYIVADEKIPGLIKAWKRLLSSDPGRAKKLRTMVEGLRSWNHDGSIASPETTWFNLWILAMADRSQVPKFARSRLGVRSVAPGPHRAVRALEAVRDRLLRGFGTIQVPWGRMNRLQRPPHYAGPNSFSDSLPSLPVPGGDADFVGDIFAFYALKPAHSPRLYGVAGDSYVAAVEFGPHVKAYSVVPWGESGDPKSPHFFDQAHLYARGQFKRAWFTLKEVKEHAAFAYHPGEKHQTIQ